MVRQPCFLNTKGLQIQSITKGAFSPAKYPPNGGEAETVVETLRISQHYCFGSYPLSDSFGMSALGTHIVGQRCPLWVETHQSPVQSKCLKLT